jgi:hypothetical protein
MTKFRLLVFLLFLPAALFAQQKPAAAQPQSAAKVYAIGERGPAGGWVFYDKGSYSDGWRYLEAAPRDAGTAEWGLYKKDISGTGTAVGTGTRNTQLILEALRQAGETGKADQLCAAFEAGGFRNWFLPSKDELDLMYRNLQVKGLGNFRGSGIFMWYWSSSQGNSYYAWGQYFGVGRQSGYSKANSYFVRAVRAF